MKRKCDKCGAPATNHSIELVDGQKQETHLCDKCAKEAGMTLDLPEAAGVPINELLTKFVKLQSRSRSPEPIHACGHCGMAFEELEEEKLLGCPLCYEAFEDALIPLLERAQEGADHHVGKTPRHAEGLELRQEQLLRLRTRLADAIAAEDYELAAHLRDEIRRIEEPA